jgi:hypothetical protein
LLQKSISSLIGGTTDRTSFRGEAPPGIHNLRTGPGRNPVPRSHGPNDAQRLLQHNRHEADPYGIALGRGKRVSYQWSFGRLNGAARAASVGCHIFLPMLVLKLQVVVSNVPYRCSAD